MHVRYVKDYGPLQTPDLIHIKVGGKQVTLAIKGNSIACLLDGKILKEIALPSLSTKPIALDFSIVLTVDKGEVLFACFFSSGYSTGLVATQKFPVTNLDGVEIVPYTKNIATSTGAVGDMYNFKCTSLSFAIGKLNSSLDAILRELLRLPLKVLY